MDYMAKGDEKSESETRMKVISGRISRNGNEWGCCVDNKGRIYCQWLIHGHPFCNNGCTWEEEE